jgi:hypothetical protein
LSILPVPQWCDSLFDLLTLTLSLLDQSLQSLDQAGSLNRQLTQFKD